MKSQQWKVNNENLTMKFSNNENLTMKIWQWKCQQWNFDNENSTMKSQQWKFQQWKTNNEMGNNEKATMKMVVAVQVYKKTVLDPGSPINHLLMYPSISQGDGRGTSQKKKSKQPTPLTIKTKT